MRNFRKLLIWKKAMNIVKEVYSITNELPCEEKYGLLSQIRRAAVSVPSNIAEGSSCNSEIEFKRFLETAMGSTFEPETQLIITQELNFLAEILINPIFELIDKEQKMINNFISKLKIM